ncbi:hypothetical protein [Ovoidimarina sediminis]|uniref:hypothetical protein n=1 Tax=Ovoidimarina sediminis TaxID=3079856 RepID=UPI0029086D18|nr:hypothetical protein [Rhodophyticola sp. MJ-SS7]MDU8946386.1 hypothetical protein [Rhodophyticola sp. MJ-SS7]
MAGANTPAMPFCYPVIGQGLRNLARDLAKAGGSDLSDGKAIGQDPPEVHHAGARPQDRLVREWMTWTSFSGLVSRSR